MLVCGFTPSRKENSLAMRRASHRLVLVAWAALPVGASGAVGGEAPSGPEAPVAALLGAEQAGRPALEDDKLRAVTLSRGLAALYRKAKAVERATGDVVIDFDAVTNSQGADVKFFDLKAEPRDRSHARVVARIDPGNWVRRSPRENVITFDLILEDGRWRIDDIRGVAEPRAWSLRAIIGRNARP
jgi:hypothetical protein